MKDKQELYINHSDRLQDVVHDLKAPLTVIAGYSDALLSGVVPTEKEKQYLETISLEAKRLSRIVSSLLSGAGGESYAGGSADLSKIEVS